KYRASQICPICLIQPTGKSSIVALVQGNNVMNKRSDLLRKYDATKLTHFFRIAKDFRRGIKIFKPLHL
ncbi:MAG: hypothetical protein LIP02_11590, partial [Bacteroidales bacterium]|nr:hypothetical protein [Bacteroidales bacterium]